MFRSFVFGLLTLGFGLGVSAQEYELRAEDSRMMTSIIQEDLEAIIYALGHTLDASQTAGDVSVRGRTGEGLLYLLIGTACSEKDETDPTAPEPTCLGVNIQVRYTADDNVTLAKINQANVDRAAVSVWLSEDENEEQSRTLGIARYLILDKGQTMGNIKENVRILLSISAYVSELMWPPAPAPATDTAE